MLSRESRLPAAAALAAMLTVVTAACATSTSARQAAAQMPAPPGTAACFRQRDAFDWTVLNNSELIVHAPLARNAYLVRLFQPVLDLSFHQSLGFENLDHTGLICGPGPNYLLVPHYSPRRIPIVAVQRLSPIEEIQLLRTAKKPVPRTLQQLADQSD